MHGSGHKDHITYHMFLVPVHCSTLATVQDWSGHKVCTWSASPGQIYENTRHNLTAACLGSCVKGWILDPKSSPSFCIQSDPCEPRDVPGEPGGGQPQPQPPPLRGQHPALCDLCGLRDIHGVLPDLPSGGLPRGQQVSGQL